MSDWDYAIEEAKKEARAEGIQKCQSEMVKRLTAKRMDPNVIADIMGLKLEEVEKIQQST